MGTYTESQRFYGCYTHKLKCIDHVEWDVLSPCDHFRLLFIESGAGVTHINGKSFIFRGLTFLCLNDKDTVSFDIAEGCTAYCINFHPSIINKSFTSHNINEEDSLIRNPDNQDAYLLRPFTMRNEDYQGVIMAYETQSYRIMQLIKKIRAELEMQKDKDWPCRSRTCFFELLMVLEPLFVDDSRPDYRLELRPDLPVDQLERMMVFLNTHYHEEISLSKLSKEFNMNRTSLENLFIKATGLPVITYIIRLRIRMASMILRDTRLPISEIVSRVGFNDRTHFTRSFKKSMGVSPRDYRAKYCQM